MWTRERAEEFFYQQAGYSVPVGADEAQTEQARRERARELASAEAELVHGAFFVTVHDDPELWNGDEPWDGPVYIVSISEVSTCGTDTEVIASLGGVAVDGPDDPYIRVVTAQLMAEHLDEQARCRD